MSKIAFLLFFSFTFLKTSSAQNVLLIQDSIYLSPINGVSVYNISQNKYMVSNNLGTVKGNFNIGDRIEVTCIGYFSKKIVILNEISVIKLQPKISVLDNITVISQSEIIYRNSKKSQASWQLPFGTNFFTSFEFNSSCKKRIQLLKFVLFQRKFSAEMKFKIAFYKDSLGFPGQRLTDYFFAPDTNRVNGKIEFDFANPLYFEDKKFFIEISGVLWPSNYTMQKLNESISIEFTNRDQNSYTIGFFSSSIPKLITNKGYAITISGNETLSNNISNRGNPMFEYSLVCIE